jgi:hypothetical protein
MSFATGAIWSSNSKSLSISLLYSSVLLFRGVKVELLVVLVELVHVGKVDVHDPVNRNVGKDLYTCMSYEEEDTCTSYEEEDTCM